MLATDGSGADFPDWVAPGETDEEFDKDFLASFMMAPRPLSLIFPPRSDI
jgi:hypothetical protein